MYYGGYRYRRRCCPIICWCRPYYGYDNGYGWYGNGYGYNRFGGFAAGIGLGLLFGFF